MTIFSPYLLIVVTFTTRCCLSDVLAHQLSQDSHDESNLSTFNVPLVDSGSPRSMSYTFLLTLFVCFIIAARTLSSACYPMQSAGSSKSTRAQTSCATMNEQDSDYTFLPAPRRSSSRHLDQLRDMIGSHKSFRSTLPYDITEREETGIVKRSRFSLSVDDSNTRTPNQDSGEDEDDYPSGKDFTHWHTDLSGIPRGPYGKIIYEAYRRPKALLGWRISVSNKGVGVVIRIKKFIGMSTKFQVKFENGMTEYLSLRRGPKKGKVPFLPINKELM